MRELAEHLKVPPAAPNMRIGLLGGSFNPAHEAHRRISVAALKRLGLDQVWWLVSPGNPLKQDQKTPALGKRVAAARAAAAHPKIVVTGFEGAAGSAYTVDTIRLLKRRYPSVDFVWLMGADNLAGFHRWRSFEEIFKLVPIAVFDRPGFRLKALASRAAQRFGFAHVDESDTRGLAGLVPPAWSMLTLPLSSLSSTGLRGGSAKPKPSPKKAKSGKAAKVEKKAAKQAKKASKQERKRAKQPGKAAKAAEQAAKKATKAAKSQSKQAKKTKKKAKRH
jgi:nicotinate-nucleotide adenylyltransferase